MMQIPAGRIAGLVAIGVMAHSASAEEEGSWVDRISMYGDLRLRHEYIHEEGNPDANSDRERGRARLGIEAEVQDDVTLVFGIATGGDNPVSRNVTGDGGFTSKEIGLELFYVDWAATESLNVYAGKMKSPLFRAGKVPLIWDSDLNLEGAAVKYSSGIFFGTLSGFSAEERSGADDSTLYAAQAGARFGMGRKSKLTTGIGYFGYTNTVGNEPFYDGSSKGNTVDAAGNYIFDYRNSEAFAQLDSLVKSWPLQLYAHYTMNHAVDRQETAYALGARIGSADQRGDLQFSWTYQNIGADAVVGTFNDSDFGGGGTDAEGSIFTGKYMLSDKINIGATVFINEIDGFENGTPHDFDRYQLDLEFKFE